MRKPKMPRASSGEQVWKNYEKRMQKYLAWKKLKERIRGKYS